MIIIPAVAAISRTFRAAALGGLIAVAVALPACGNSSETASVPQGECPSAPVKVTVTIDQWSDLVETLAGDCATVTTVIDSTATDPHEFEPTAADTAKFTGSQLVVENGLGYDSWADKIIFSLTPPPAVVNGGKVAGLVDGDNPHLWYSPDFINELSAEVTQQLKELLPAATTYLDQNASEWEAALQPYKDQIAKIASIADGRTYAATESVYDYTAQAVGLKDLTPSGYATAAANEIDPAPGDLTDFNTALNAGTVDVLVVNTQTEGSLPGELRSTAEKSKVSVVEVTETQPAEAADFVAWQVGQLEQLASALAAPKKP